MAVEFHGPYLATYDDPKDLQQLVFQPGAVEDFSQVEGSALLEHPSREDFWTAADLRAACPDSAMPLPRYIPTGFRPIGWHVVRGESGRSAYALAAYAEENLHVQPMALGGGRPLGPDDAAISVWWNRVLQTPSVYLRDEPHPRETSLESDTPERAEVGGFPAMLLRYRATGSESLRSRRIPDEAVIWFDELDRAWRSVHANAAPGEALRIAGSIYE